MAGERTLPGLGLHGFWTLGSGGYRTQHSGNLRTLSALTQCRVISRTTSLPGSPTVGDMYIVPTGDANAEAIAIRDYDTDDSTEIWVYLTPSEGYFAWVEDDDEYVTFNGTVWGASFTVPAAVTTSVDEKTASYTLVAGDFDGKKIIKMNLAGANTLTVPSGLSVTEPVHFIQSGLGATTITASGTTLNNKSGLVTDGVMSLGSIIPDGADNYLVVGDLTT